MECAHEREDAVVRAAGGLEARDSSRQSPLRGPGDSGRPWGPGTVPLSQAEVTNRCLARVAPNYVESRDFT